MPNWAEKENTTVTNLTKHMICLNHTDHWDWLFQEPIWCYYHEIAGLAESTTCLMQAGSKLGVRGFLSTPYPRNASGCYLGLLGSTPEISQEQIWTFWVTTWDGDWGWDPACTTTVGPLTSWTQSTSGSPAPCSNTFFLPASAPSSCHPHHLCCLPEPSQN